MKHISQYLHIFAALLCGACIFNSCGSDEIITAQPSTEYFKIVGNTIVIDGKATSAQFNVSADCYWTITTEGWTDLQVTPDRGEGSQMVKITTSENSTPTFREGKLTLSTSEGITKVMIVRQLPGEVELKLSVADTLSFGKEEGSNIVTVTSNSDWTVSGGSDWCRFAVNGDTTLTESSLNGSITVSVDENPVATTRKTILTVTPSGGTPVSFVVKQSDKIISVSASPQSLYFNAIGEQTKQVKIICNDAWTIISSEDWVNLSILNGTGDGTVDVTCDANETGESRNATLLVQAGGEKYPISVSQSKQDAIEITLNVSPEELFFSALGTESHEVKVFCNESWTAKVSSGNWLHLNVYNGVGDGKILVTCDANNTENNRETYITIMSGDIPKTVKVSQSKAAAPTLSTVVVTKINKGSATFAASYTSPLTVSEYGFCYATHSSPSTSDTKVRSTNADGSGRFTVTLPANTLTRGVNYHVRAYAISPVGISYSESTTFVYEGDAPDSDDIDTPTY